VFRLVWGVIGTRHARFAGFLSGPVSVVRYARSLVDGTHAESPGHNPMGGWMVVIMLALVGAQVLTGLFSDDDIIWAGPWAGAVDRPLVKALTGWHHTNFNLILAAIAAHIAAIATYQLALRTNLIGPMMTGRKSAARVPASAAISGTPWLRAILAAAVAGAVVYAVLAFAPSPPADYDYGTDY
jgi:cytochrome b